MKEETLRPTGETAGQDEAAQGRLGATLARLLGNARSSVAARIGEIRDRNWLKNYRSRLLNRNYSRNNYVDLAIQEIDRDFEKGKFDIAFRDSLKAEIREAAATQQATSKFGA